MIMINQTDVNTEEGADMTPRRTRRKVRWWQVVAVLIIIAISLLLLRIYNNYQLLNSLNSQPAPQSQQNPSDLIPAGTVIYPELNRQHVEGKVIYDRSPPVGGAHAPVWLNCGIYDLPVANENAVHSLEHGSVWITYLPDLPQPELDALRTLVKASYEGTERYVILSPHPGQSAPVVASAWGYQLTLQDSIDPRLKIFINYFRNGPQTLERGGRCTGGTGSPIG
jgi:Protein of unknown function (DUF3105)